MTTNSIEDETFDTPNKGVKEASLMAWDESTETIANDHHVTEVHIEIAQDDKFPQERTVPFEKVPIWMQDNAFITDAYRPPLFSYKHCLKSLFYQHNESGKVDQFFASRCLHVVLNSQIFIGFRSQHLVPFAGCYSLHHHWHFFMVRLLSPFETGTWISRHSCILYLYPWCHGVHEHELKLSLLHCSQRNGKSAFLPSPPLGCPLIEISPSSRNGA
jgi:hypothetical protein